jgi:hypothetical protein
MAGPDHSSALFGEIESPDYELGAEIAVALAAGASWKHRKVESLRLLEGEFGRRRVSLDLTPIGSDLEELGYSDGRLVPLTMLLKRPLRDFDVSDQGGQPLPVLGRTDDGYVAWSVLAARFSTDLGTSLSEDLLDDLHCVVHLPSPEASAIAADLAKGRVKGQPAFDPSKVEEQTRFLTNDLANYFLLIALLPGDADRRQIIKYSSHWQVDPPNPRPSPFERFQVGLGFRAMPLNLAIGGASDAASYHLEVHALPGMLISNLSLPVGSGQSPFREDDQIGVVGHAVESYAGAPQSSAKLTLTVPRGGIRTVALFTTAFTAIVFWLDRVLSGGHKALLESSDGAAAVLLIVPAAYSLALSRPTENMVLSHLLWPLRVLTFGCIALLLFGAASLVGYLHTPYSGWLWWGGAIAAALSFIVQCWAWFVSEARDTTW